jgi:hypothetical protein
LSRRPIHDHRFIAALIRTTIPQRIIMPLKTTAMAGSVTGTVRPGPANHNQPWPTISHKISHFRPKPL